MLSSFKCKTPFSFCSKENREGKPCLLEQCNYWKSRRAHAPQPLLPSVRWGGWDRQAQAPRAAGCHFCTVRKSPSFCSFSPSQAVSHTSSLTIRQSQRCFPNWATGFAGGTTVELSGISSIRRWATPASPQRTSPRTLLFWAKSLTMSSFLWAEIYLVLKVWGEKFGSFRCGLDYCTFCATAPQNPVQVKGLLQRCTGKKRLL